MNKPLHVFIALLLVVATVLSIPMPAMAAETEDGIPSSATAHTVEFTVQPGEELTTDEASSVMPRMWEQKVYTVPYATTTYTPQFVIPNRYFAYEFVATSPSGISSTLSVNLIYHGITVTNATGYVNGDSKKIDWIDVNANSSYYFQIINNATSEITVTLTYYSWA